jgi:hypothetical protein
MIENFLKNGFIILNDKKSFKFIDIYDLQWTDAGNVGLQIVIKENKIQNELLQTQKYLGEKYVKQIDINYKFFDKIDLVNGMDDATLIWHNDLIKESNLCILMYFDTMDKDIGGAIQFRFAHNKKLINSYYPKQHDIIIMNQSLKFEHKVTSLKIKMPRKVASFNYLINKNLTI